MVREIDVHVSAASAVGSIGSISASVNDAISKRRGNVWMRGNGAKRVRRARARFEQRFHQTLSTVKAKETQIS